MDLSEVFCDQRDAQLNEWKGQLEQIWAQADQARDQAKLELYRELHDLQSRYDGVCELLSRARQGSATAWDDVQTRLENAWSELKQAFELASARFS